MRTTSNFLIVSMAVSDCLCTVMVIPKLITQIFTYPAAWLITGAVGNYLCLIITVAVSLLNLMIAIGVGKSLNGREKNSDEEKSRTQRRAPWDKVLTNQFQTVTVILASDWCQKAFVFFCPITEQQDYKQCSVFLHHRYIQASCSPLFTRGGKFQSQHKTQGRSFGISARNSPQIRWTFRRHRNISAFNRLRVFVHSQMSIKFSAFRNMTWELNIFPLSWKKWIVSPIFLTSLAVTKTFPALSNISSQGPGSYVGYYVLVN